MAWSSLPEYPRKCANNSTVKYMKNFKKIILMCIDNGWLDKDPFIKYKPKVKIVARDYLTKEELQTMALKTNSSLRIEQVKDIFYFLLLHRVGLYRC
ncbi:MULTISPECIES: phage integrase SAM-like domain-containing protein [unclassified Mucilaginibacter]|uniref:phage integrase SAM-like domain-containing protein n=1 Tax=unclassified Mucilaginibacter TaxID=2617802 RepID=UPI002AC8C851|nr:MULTISPECIES: phage integrase SAM-like domain-containing protein [unclassified Mucilaginibacter]MEB0261576.1 phage integrase SAM-like domain-containing protein [Mucilaginibacter sp. 10I4]MEB0277172.1 phage integrase SAM-like domain-containing protein [Mucilaginibacter sp. 10B2]MEB0300820.1 phage integrase SAM-like domain-containing protein [Mucilaginibacter sp. 5C4]WPX25712.1 phage integrase SAM-like domain-containing protein [Mucilaginibacter sp. 5C4]